MIKGMDHVAISTGNFERSLGFYRDLLGMEVLYDGQFSGEIYDRIMTLKGASGRIAILRVGYAQLELFEFKSPEARQSDPMRPVCDHGITHLCFSVTEIQKEYQRLKEAGVEFHCEPLNFGWAEATYGRDPDGNVFELLEVFNREIPSVNQ